MVPTELGKFDPHAMRSAPKAAMNLPKNVSGAPLPQPPVGVTLIGVIFS
jgi:hypothetical protein